MKIIYFSSLALLPLLSFAQQTITVTEQEQSMSKGMQTSYYVEIPQTHLKEVEKDWLKYGAEKSKGKTISANGENLQNEAVNQNISAKPFSLYSKLMETTDHVQVSIWVSEDNVTFISNRSLNNKGEAVKKYLYDFAIMEYKKAVSEELSMETKSQKDMEKQLDALIKEDEKSNKKINSNQAAIKSAADVTMTTNTNLAGMDDKISAQQQMVLSTASDPNAHKGAEKSLKDLQNQRADMIKLNENNVKNTDNWNKEIREEERKISDNKEKQTQQVAALDIQKQKVQSLSNKLAHIS